LFSVGNDNFSLCFEKLLCLSNVLQASLLCVLDTFAQKRVLKLFIPR
jgi:hypothetical protein